MSYILDALKKAERERHQTKIPTLQTVHRKPWQPRRGHWLWIVVVVVALVNVGLLIWLLRPAPLYEKPVTPPATTASAKTPPATATPTAPASSASSTAAPTTAPAAPVTTAPPNATAAAGPGTTVSPVERSAAT